MKRLLCCLLLFAVSLSLFACGSGGQPAPTAELSTGAEMDAADISAGPDDWEWALKTQELTPFGAAFTVRGMARSGETILFSLSDGDRHSLALSQAQIQADGSLALSTPVPVPMDEPEADDEAFLYQVTAGGDGDFYVLTGELPASYLSGGEIKANPDRENSYRILRYSPAGELLQTVALPGFELEDLIGVGAPDGEHLLVYSNQAAALLDASGAVRSRAFLPEDVYVLSSQLCGNSLILSAFSPRGMSLFYEIDVETGALNTLPIPQDITNWTDCQGLGDEYLLQAGGFFYELDLQSGDQAEVLQWNYTNTDCEGALRLGEQSFLCREPGSGTLTFAYRVLQEARERETAQVAIYCEDDFAGLGSSAESALRGFENEDGRYHFEVTRYEEGELDMLLTVLSTPDAPDLVIFNQGINTATSAFEDLYPYLDADPELGRDSFLPNLLEDLSVSGELHELWTEVNVYTLAARAADVGDGRGLTTADYDRILAESDQYQALFQTFMDKHNLLLFVSTVGISHYVDRASGACSFDDPHFRELLAWCSQMCDPVPEGSFDVTPLYPEDVVLWLVPLQAPGQVHNLDSHVFQEPFVFVGFPTGDDNGSFYIQNGLSMAIPRAAGNKEGAWAFLRSRLLPKAQQRLRFPVHLDTMLSLAREDLNEDEISLLLDLLEHTGFAENIADAPLRRIVIECGTAYLGGEKTLDEAIELLQSRASIYLSERYG